MWPTMKPWVAPLKRPSVIRADIVAEATADQCGGHGEHLAHARAAGRAFVADHQHVAGLDRVRLHGGEGGFFAFEHARRPS